MDQAKLNGYIRQKKLKKIKKIEKMKQNIIKKKTDSVN